MNGTSPLAVCEPERLGSRWVTVSIDKMTEDQVFLQVSILVGGDEEIYGRDIQVHLLAGPHADPLTATAFPKADFLLPEMRLRSRTALAGYVFANPGQHRLQEAVVTLGTDTGAFNLRSFALPPQR